MKQLFVGTLFVASLLFVSCNEKYDKFEEEDDYEYRVKPMASDEVVAHSTAIVGSIPDDIRAALHIRFTNQTAQIDPSTTRVLIFHANFLNAIDEEAFLEFYHNNGIVVILDTDHDYLAEWLEKIGVRHALSGQTPHELYAFNQSDNHYFLDYVATDSDHNDYVNSLVNWINRHAQGLMNPPRNISPTDVSNFFKYQQIEKTFNLSLNKEVRYINDTLLGTIKGTGQVDVAYMVYPLYAFEDQASNGDYYIVSMTVTAHNNSMYMDQMGKSKVADTHTGNSLDVAFRGFYMESLGVKAEILDSNQKVVSDAVFPLNGTPKPLTTIGSTEYTHGLEWSLQGTLTGKAEIDESGKTDIYFSFTIEGGVTFNNEETRTLLDVETHNNWSSGSTVDYTYPINNLPRAINTGSTPVTDPPPVSVNNAEFKQDWVWRVPSTTDYGQQQFSIRVSIAPVYGNWWYVYGSGQFNPLHWSDAVVGGASFTVALPTPSRVPTGELHINNTIWPGWFITDIKIWKSDETGAHSGDPNYTVSGALSYAYGDTMKTYLPVGYYYVEFMAGASRDELTRYYSYFPVKIDRVKTTTVLAGFDFVPGTY